MNLESLQKLGKQVADKATQTAQGTASGLSEKAVRAAVDQTINVIQIAAQQVKKRNVPAKTVKLGANVTIGIIQLSMNIDMPTEGEPEEIEVDITDGSEVTPILLKAEQ